MKKTAIFSVLLVSILSFGATANELAPSKSAPPPVAEKADAHAQLKKTLMERVPQIKKVDSVMTTPIAGLFEARVNGSDILYVDDKGDHLIQGSIINIKEKRNLTQERIDKLTAIKFEDLPFKDAIKVVHGNGERKMAVFEDPNCGYCKKFEKELQKVDNVTVYTFLFPILGQSSVDKSNAIWCSADRASTWSNLMTKEVAAAPAAESCNVDAVKRNVEYGKSLRITGTPTLFFANGKRIPGAIDVSSIEKHLNEK